MPLHSPDGALIRAKYSVLQAIPIPETCWAIEQCLRCPGVSATWAWIDGESPADSPPLATAAEVGGGVGLFFRPEYGSARARLGRLAIAGHTAGRRPRRRPDAFGSKCSIAGAAGRHRPGLGDRPCRGCCASGSRSGRSSGCGAKGPSLSDRSSCFSPSQNQRPVGHAFAARRPSAWACIAGQPLAEAKALLPNGRISSRRFRRGSQCTLPAGTRLPAIFPPGRSGRGHSRITVLRRHRLHAPLERRGAVSQRGSRLLDAKGLSRPARACRHSWGPPGRSLTAESFHRAARGVSRWLCRAYPCASLRLPPPLWSAWSPGPLYDWRHPGAPSRDAGQPFRRDLAATAGPGSRPVPEIFVCERLKEPLLGFSRVGGADRRSHCTGSPLLGSCFESFCRWPAGWAWVFRS